MSARCIRLGCGRAVTLAAYVKAWERALSMPGESVVLGAPSDSRLPSTAAEALREFRAGLHDRINRHVPSYGNGRKWESDWQRAARYTAALVSRPRAVVDWIPRDLQARLAHRLRSPE